MRTVTAVVVDILSKKLPADVNFNNQKLDTVMHKIKLVPVPKGVVTDTQYKEESCYKDSTADFVVIKKALVERNTGERAIVRLRIPLRRVEEEEEWVHPVTCEVQKRLVEKMQEIDIDDKVLLVPARVEQAPYSIFVLNQAVPKWQRREVFNTLKKSFPEYFEGKDMQNECELMNARADEIAEIIEKQFL